MKRSISRELTMKLFYQLEVSKSFDEEIIAEFLQENSHEDLDVEYVKTITKHYIENNEYVDGIINSNSKGWKINRIAKVDLSILRIAITELIYKKDIPVKVVVNEAIELSKRYSDKDSFSFINGILGSVINELQ